MSSRAGRPQPGAHLVVGGLSPRATTGTIACGGLRFPCTLGRSGRRALKREGDGATPMGRFALREVLYRPDRLRRPRTWLPVRAIGPRDGWCDDPRDRNYNRRVRHPYPASAERLWRSDGLYDLVVVIGYNDRPRARGRGSAIFVHVAGAGATEGCIALERAHLLALLARLPRGGGVIIAGAVPSRPKRADADKAACKKRPGSRRARPGRV